MTDASARSSLRALAWLLAFAVVAWLPLARSVGGDVVAAAPRAHVVRPGETLWAIAARSAGEGGDVDALMDRIVALNRLAPRPLRPGQLLRLPEEAAR